jgi:glycosyltransferase involved in cell wall biosynthesis
MKVAILLLNSGRGSGEVARQQARYLVSAGHTVYYMHPRLKEGVDGATNIDIPLHTEVTPVHEHLPSAGDTQKQVARMSYAQAHEYLPSYESALEEVIDDVDIIVGHHANISAIATANVARRHRLPYVLFLHGTGIEPRHEGLYDDRLWAEIDQAVRDADGILVTTDYVRDELVRNMVDLPEDRFLVLPCGLDLEEFRPGRCEETMNRYDLPETFVICPGALTLSKGPQSVVEASRQYSDLAPTVFIGDGELRGQLEEQLGDRGRFLGFVSAADKAALIRSATLMVAAPKKKEHFGIIYTEALAAGTPPVAYEGGGVSSIITPETGILVDRDEEKLGREVRALLADPVRRDAMAVAGRGRAEANYGWQDVGRRLADWLHGMLQPA